MPGTEQKKRTKLTLISGPFAYKEAVKGITQFQTTHESTVTRHGAENFGGNGPIGLTEFYLGESGTANYEGKYSERVMSALMNGIIPGDDGAPVVFDPRNKKPLWAVVNAYEDDGVTPIKSVIVKEIMFGNVSRQIGPETRTADFQARIAEVGHELHAKVTVHVGAVTPVTALPFGETAYLVPAQSPDTTPTTAGYARLVLRQNTVTGVVRELELTTGYNETATGITLITGLSATEKALVVHYKAP